MAPDPAASSVEMPCASTSTPEALHVCATRPGRLDRLHFRDEVVDRVYATHWGIEAEDLLEAVWNRGFDSMHTFHRIAEPFVARLKRGLLPEVPATVRDLAPVG